MPVRRVGSRWLVDIRYRGKRIRVRSPGTTKADAQAHESYLRGELAKHGSLGHLDVPPARAMTFAEFAELWVRDYVIPNNKFSEQLAKRTILRLSLLPAFGDRRLDEIGAHDVARWKRMELERGLSAKTVNNRINVLRRLLRSAVDWELIERAPRIQPVKIPTRPPFRFLSPDEVTRLARAAHTPLVRALIVCAAHTGLRWGELAALDWEDIDFGRQQLHVAKSFVHGRLGTPKNGVTRYVPLTPEVVRELESLARSGGPVFVFRGSRVVDVTASKWIARASAAAGIPRLGWHVLRHTFASELVSRGVSLATVRDLLGHSTIKMTERYAHLAPGVAREAMRVLRLPDLYREAGHAMDTPERATWDAIWSNMPDSSSSSAQPTQDRALADAA